MVRVFLNNFFVSQSQSPALSSDQTPENSCPDDASSNGAKDDDEDEDEDDDKLDGLTCGDPEKLKAFNVSHFLPRIDLMKINLFSAHRCLFVCLWMRILTDTFPFPNNQRRKFKLL